MKNKIDPIIINICKKIKDSNGRAFIVGGVVRDMMMDKILKDYDIEVYFLSSKKLLEVLRKFGSVNTVGASFTVYKLSIDKLEIDVSLPRKDTKTGIGHKGFVVEGDPDMDFKDAAKRRDFTINSIMYDPLKDHIIDYFNGLKDIKNKIIKAVSPKTFIEDSLRVLRAVQFAGRFEFSISSETIDLCKSIDLSDLPCERIWTEFEKLFLLSNKPSIGLKAAMEMHVIDKLLPEISTMANTLQDKEWHPEGDVFTHTLLTVDNAVNLTKELTKEKKLTIILASLLHDIAKPETTRFERGHIRSPAHEELGRKPTIKILDRLNIHSINGYNVRDQVVALVTNHLKPSQLYHDKDKVTDGAFRRLSRKCSLKLLYLVAKSDALGRDAMSECEAQEWFISRAKDLSVDKSPPKSLLLGRHLIELGMSPGPKMGKIIGEIFELQLDGLVKSTEEAISEAEKLLQDKL